MRWALAVECLYLIRTAWSLPQYAGEVEDLVFGPIHDFLPDWIDSHIVDVDDDDVPIMRNDMKMTDESRRMLEASLIVIGWKQGSLHAGSRVIVKTGLEGESGRLISWNEDKMKVFVLMVDSLIGTPIEVDAKFVESICEEECPSNIVLNPKDANLLLKVLQVTQSTNDESFEFERMQILVLDALKTFVASPTNLKVLNQSSLLPSLQRFYCPSNTGPLSHMKLTDLEATSRINTTLLVDASLDDGLLPDGKPKELGEITKMDLNGFELKQRIVCLDIKESLGLNEVSIEFIEGWYQHFGYDSEQLIDFLKKQNEESSNPAEDEAEADNDENNNNGSSNLPNPQRHPAYLPTFEVPKVGKEDAKIEMYSWLDVPSSGLVTSGDLLDHTLSIPTGGHRGNGSFGAALNNSGAFGTEVMQKIKHVTQVAWETTIVSLPNSVISNGPLMIGIALLPSREPSYQKFVGLSSAGKLVNTLPIAHATDPIDQIFEGMKPLERDDRVSIMYDREKRCVHFWINDIPAATSYKGIGKVVSASPRTPSMRQVWFHEKTQSTDSSSTVVSSDGPVAIEQAEISFRWTLARCIAAADPSSQYVMDHLMEDSNDSDDEEVVDELEPVLKMRNTHVPAVVRRMVTSDDGDKCLVLDRSAGNQRIRFATRAADVEGYVAYRNIPRNSAFPSTTLLKDGTKLIIPSELMGWSADKQGIKNCLKAVYQSLRGHAAVSLAHKIYDACAENQGTPTAVFGNSDGVIGYLRALDETVPSTPEDRKALEEHARALILRDVQKGGSSFITRLTSSVTLELANTSFPHRDRSQSQVILRSPHPIPKENMRRTICIPDANFLVIRFDARSNLGENGSIKIFHPDGVCVGCMANSMIPDEIVIVGDTFTYETIFDNDDDNNDDDDDADKSLPFGFEFSVTSVLQANLRCIRWALWAIRVAFDEIQHIPKNTLHTKPLISQLIKRLQTPGAEFKSSCCALLTRILLTVEKFGLDMKYKHNEILRSINQVLKPIREARDKHEDGLLPTGLKRMLSLLLAKQRADEMTKMAKLHMPFQHHHVSFSMRRVLNSRRGEAKALVRIRNETESYHVTILDGGLVTSYGDEESRLSYNRRGSVFEFKEHEDDVENEYITNVAHESGTSTAEGSVDKLPNDVVCEMGVLRRKDHSNFGGQLIEFSCKFEANTMGIEWMVLPLAEQVNKEDTIAHLSSFESPHEVCGSIDLARYPILIVEEGKEDFITSVISQLHKRLIVVVAPSDMIKKINEPETKANPFPIQKSDFDLIFERELPNWKFGSLRVRLYDLYNMMLSMERGYRLPSFIFLRAYMLSYGSTSVVSSTHPYIADEDFEVETKDDDEKEKEEGETKAQNNKRKPKNYALSASLPSASRTRGTITICVELLPRFKLPSDKKLMLYCLDGEKEVNFVVNGRSVNQMEISLHCVHNVTYECHEEIIARVETEFNRKKKKNDDDEDDEENSDESNLHGFDILVYYHTLSKVGVGHGNKFIKACRVSDQFLDWGPKNDELNALMKFQASIGSFAPGDTSRFHLTSIRQCNSYPVLDNADVVRLNFYSRVIQMFNDIIVSQIGSLSFDVSSTSTFDYSMESLLSRFSRFVTASTKGAILSKYVSATKSTGEPESITLNNSDAAMSSVRGDVSVDDSKCIFAQAFKELYKVNLKKYRRELDDKGRVFHVKFEGEEGIDHGGVFREVSVCCVCCVCLLCKEFSLCKFVEMF
eukprot:TRINITY_DN530_c0_g3_i1.p1 TRINITY_DN530_c0_g3~~TRINITY_DN530_c0_g3_i1.p1  ORF type:complete len:1726 (-),score=587.11 TRINITY_DN530_c0_g3_i1:1493-6670(-)